jgi:adenosylcobinamide kinase/adenosylcobinamide-phosphate guanylyltransferase
VAELIIGGARSGKSTLAEQRARDGGASVVYVATARLEDGDMAERIAHHRARRPPDWATVEEPLALASALERLAASDTCIIVDCLTLWLSNLFFAGRGAAQAEAGAALDCPLLRGAVTDLVEVLPRLPGRVLLVTNELGWGVVPENRLARLFADEQGRLNQRVAAVSQRVTLTVAGLPLELKGARC